MAKVAIYQGEAKSLPFRIKDKATGRWLDLTGATLLLTVKRTPEDEVAVITKLDAQFNKAGIASGYLTVFLTAYDTWQEPWKYAAELRIVKTGTPVPVEKLPFDLEIMQAVSPSDWTLEPLGIASLEAVGAPAI
jgi:hypothetical protein